MCDCQGKTYNIAMCCEPQIKLGPIENYYTKPATDRRIQEEISGISAVTIDEVQEMIDEAVSGITVSGVTEEEMNNAIASAKTEIEAEIPSLDGYATEQWVEDKHYITGVDLSDYSTTEQMNNAITAATDGLATTAYVNTQISAETGDFIDGEELSSYTYDKATIDSKIASGGTGITSGEVQTMIDSSISGKADSSAVTEEISAAVSGKQDTLIAGRGISITTGETADTVSFNLPISAGTGVNSIVEGTNTKASGSDSHAEGNGTVASGDYSHAEGYNTVASGQLSHVEGVRTRASGQSAHAEGIQTYANGSEAHAEGANTQAAGDESHAEGSGSKANGFAAHSEGQATSALTDCSHTEGFLTIANNLAEHASGQRNITLSASTTFGDSGNTLFTVGNAINDSRNLRHNAFEIRQDGSIFIPDISGGTAYYDRPMIKLQDALAQGGGSFDPTQYYKKTETSGATEIANALNQKQDTLTPGTGVNISGNVISMKIWSGTKAQFDAITVKDNETIYLVTD